MVKQLISPEKIGYTGSITISTQRALELGTISGRKVVLSKSQSSALPYNNSPLDNNI